MGNEKLYNQHFGFDNNNGSTNSNYDSRLGYSSTKLGMDNIGRIFCYSVYVIHSRTGYAKINKVGGGESIGGDWG